MLAPRISKRIEFAYALKKWLAKLCCDATVSVTLVLEAMSYSILNLPTQVFLDSSADGCCLELGGVCLDCKL